MSEDAVVEAINDLTRVIIAFSPSGSKYESIRKLHIAGLRSSRIAILLDVPLKDVTSLVAKLRKSGKSKGKGGDE